MVATARVRLCFWRRGTQLFAIREYRVILTVRIEPASPRRHDGPQHGYGTAWTPRRGAGRYCAHGLERVSMPSRYCSSECSCRAPSACDYSVAHPSFGWKTVRVNPDAWFQAYPPDGDAAIVALLARARGAGFRTPLVTVGKDA
jgi:hypothetical protein